MLLSITCLQQILRMTEDMALSGFMICMHGNSEFLVDASDPHNYRKCGSIVLEAPLL